MTAVEGKDDKPVGPIPEVHAHIIGELQRDKTEQWKLLNEHDEWLLKTRIRVQMVRYGVVALVLAGAGALVVKEGGWTALASILLGR